MLRSHMLAAGVSPQNCAARTGFGATGIVALGTIQSNATNPNCTGLNAGQIPTIYTITTSSASTGVLLPPCEEGANLTIYNNSGQNLIVYPKEASGVTINNGATSFTLNSGKSMSVYAPSYNTWFTNLTA